MQQEVDLQKDQGFEGTGVQLLSISPDSVEDWSSENGKLHITEPTLSDGSNKV
ncbi:MAG: hypothetical protein ACRDHI_07500 [Actinomycetota bacterium]